MWDSHLRNKATGAKIDSVSVVEEGEHGFIRLKERTLEAPHVTAGTSIKALSSNDKRIHVSTDVYVGPYGEGVKLHDGESG